MSENEMRPEQQLRAILRERKTRRRWKAACYYSLVLAAAGALAWRFW